MESRNADRTPVEVLPGPRPYGQWAVDIWLLGLLLLVFGRVSYVYPQLPAQIPTHFDLAGRPDGWAHTGIWSAYGLPAFALIMGVALAVTIWLIGRARDPRKLVNMPGKERLTAAGVEALRTITMRLLGVLKLITVAMMAHMHWLTIDIALGKRNGMGYVPLIYIVLITISTLYMLVALFTVTAGEKRPRAGGSRDG